MLGTALEDAQGRKDFRDRTTAASAGARTAAAVLIALPVLGIGLGELIDAHPTATLLGGGLGSVMLLIGVCFVAAEVLWTDALIDRVTR